MNGRFGGHKDRPEDRGAGRERVAGAARALRNPTVGRGRPLGAGRQAEAAERINQLAEQFYEVQEEQRVQ